MAMIDTIHMNRAQRNMFKDEGMMDQNNNDY